jgi:2-polyprenyl-6-methoxyphenol hydroxylase-like FAD-dependent oxidoreductase
VIDDANRPGDPLWRVIGDVPDLLAHLDATPTGPAVWESSFHISHRINDRMQVGQVYFAGDSAHIHSPVGARGMNLGIEDAWVFSRLVKSGRLSEYHSLRHEVDRRVMRRIEFISRLARGESSIARGLRATALPLLTTIPPTRRRIIQTVTGLDHPLPMIG